MIRSRSLTHGRSQLALWGWLGLTLLWTAVIFGKSAEPYRQQDLKPWLAARIGAAELQALLPNRTFTYDGQRVSPQQPYEMAEFFIRKAGHVSEYALLAWLWTRTLLHNAATRPRRRAVPISALISILYAASDEWHQSFVPGRTGHAIDVAVDAAGVTAAASLEAAAAIVARFRQQKKK